MEGGARIGQGGAILQPQIRCSLLADSTSWLGGGGGGGVLSTFGRFYQWGGGGGGLSTFGRFSQWGGGGGVVHFWPIQPVGGRVGAVHFWPIQPNTCMLNYITGGGGGMVPPPWGHP